MNILAQLGVYLILCYVGNFVAQFLPFPFPGSVIAMLLLFVFLLTKLIKPKQLEDVSHFLLKYMALFFLLPTVEIIDSFALLGKRLWPFIVISIVSTLTTFLVTGFVTSWLMRWQQSISPEAGDPAPDAFCEDRGRPSCS